MSKLKLISGKGNDDEDSLSNVSVEIKSQSKRLVRITTGLCRDSLTLYRNFNGLMRNFYQENYRAVNNVRALDSPSVKKKSEELEGRVRALDDINEKSIDKKKKSIDERSREKGDTFLLEEESLRLKKKHNRRKRVIVWNAWVIDTSSESSSSDSDG